MHHTTLTRLIFSNFTIGSENVLFANTPRTVFFLYSINVYMERVAHYHLLPPAPIAPQKVSYHTSFSFTHQGSPALRLPESAVCSTGSANRPHRAVVRHFLPPIYLYTTCRVSRVLLSAVSLAFPSSTRIHIFL